MQLWNRRAHDSAEGHRAGVPLTLGDVPKGATVRVIGFIEPGTRSSLRLAELGFVPGSTVTALRSAPFGDPTQYAVVGGRVALRRCEAERILVEEIA